MVQAIQTSLKGSLHKMGHGTASETPKIGYKDLFRLGGAAGLIVVALTVCEVIGFTFFPQPSAVLGWFALFQSKPIIGLLDFWGLEVLMYLMFAIVFLALHAALRRTNEGAMLIALALALLGISVFFATNNPFAMLSLSRQFASATGEVERAAFLAAGQALLSNTGQRAVGGFNMGLFLVSIAGLIFSAVMLRSDSFGRSTAYMGILAFALSLADYLRQALTQSVIVALPSSFRMPFRRPGSPLCRGLFRLCVSEEPARLDQT
jgi:hypothetical protein